MPGPLESRLEIVVAGKALESTAALEAVANDSANALLDRARGRPSVARGYDALAAPPAHAVGGAALELRGRW